MTSCTFSQSLNFGIINPQQAVFTIIFLITCPESMRVSLYMKSLTGTIIVKYKGSVISITESTIRSLPEKACSSTVEWGQEMRAEICRELCIYEMNHGANVLIDQLRYVKMRTYSVIMSNSLRVREISCFKCESQSDYIHPLDSSLPVHSWSTVMYSNRFEDDVSKDNDSHMDDFRWDS